MMQIFPVLDDAHHQILASFDRSGTNSITSSNSANNSSPVIVAGNSGPSSGPGSPIPHSKTGITSGDQHTSSTGSLTSQQQAQLQAHRNSMALYSKSIAQSAKDQQYFLTLDELHSKDYTFSSKIVIFTTNAIARLSKEQYLVSCLALTGLTKLATKNASDIMVDERIAAARSDHISTIGNKVLRKRSSFMVATNSLSESSEERLLTEIKLDLNKNNWSKLSSFGEVLGANFKRSADSLSHISKLNMDTSHSKLGPSGGSRSNLALDSLHTHFLVLPNSHSKSNLASSPPMDAQSNFVSMTSADGAGRSSGDRHETSLDCPASVTPVKDLHIDTAASTPAHPDIPQRDSEVNTHLQAPYNAPIHNDQQQLSNHSNLSLARLMSPLVATKENSTIPQSPPPLYATPPPDNNHPPYRRKPSLTTIKRATSLKVNSEADYSKSKKIAANTVSQLLLDWLETRQEPLFSGDLVRRLIDVWRAHGMILWWLLDANFIIILIRRDHFIKFSSASGKSSKNSFR